jgi:hypothetical protein
MDTLFNYPKELFHHNLVRIVLVFFPRNYENFVLKNDDGALQVLTQLIDVIPEARLNLVIYYLKQGINREIYSILNLEVFVLLR